MYNRHRYPGYGYPGYDCYSGYGYGCYPGYYGYPGYRYPNYSAVLLNSQVASVNQQMVNLGIQTAVAQMSYLNQF